mmetsp:Transcript_56241/g.115016  ORF Transcript_56241/g.115016 Transcript_56241/m.115016 type:complete len:223 (-) Transcript_56241:528-1196(-)
MEPGVELQLLVHAAPRLQAAQPQAFRPRSNDGEPAVHAHVQAEHRPPYLCELDVFDFQAVRHIVHAKQPTLRRCDKLGAVGSKARAEDCGPERIKTPAIAPRRILHLQEHLLLVRESRNLRGVAGRWQCVRTHSKVSLAYRPPPPSAPPRAAAFSRQQHSHELRVHLFRGLDWLDGLRRQELHAILHHMFALSQLRTRVRAKREVRRWLVLQAHDLWLARAC